MICTVDSESSMEVPPDGVCDFIFYDSLREPFERLGQPSRGNFKTFQSVAAKGRKTQFGVSIFAVDISQFLAHLNRPAATAWAKEKLWNHNIYHWGVMNMHQTITGVPGYFENALFTLKKAADISEPSPLKRVASYTFLGYYGEKKVACDEATQHLQSIYTPHALVFLGHISFKEHEIESEVPNFLCIILPPSIYTIPPSVKDKLVYGHTFNDAVSVVKCLSEKGINPLPIYAISVTLKGRWYRPKLDDINVPTIGAYGVFEECDSFLEYAVPQLVSTIMQDWAMDITPHFRNW
ncbi:hypothetical protein HPB49_008005 [Dermacentor silvarum]|uniref:Uncharacterized protein n=1 Tax=Dermacentor silvarum TaxID=543639 RepID=A0ACB8CQW1_DERSI|nr:hypothetical protein HPB49_008005 [Dermacentor silvarum]